MKAAVLHRATEIRIEERTPPSPGPREVLVRIRAVGLCGSDVHYYAHGKMGAHAVTQPLILGHECSGEIVEIGSEAKRLRPGMRVVLEPGIPCGECASCRRGLYNVCRNVRFMGTPPVDGALCEEVAWPEDFTFELPDGVSFEEGAMVEPFAVGVHAVRIGELHPGESAAILGSAAIGLATLTAARCAGAGMIAVTDLISHRLELAKKLGAHLAIDVTKSDVKSEILSATGGEGVDVVFEAAGTPVAVRQALDLVRPGGRIVLIGICHEDVYPFDFGNLRRKEAAIRPVRRYRHVFPECLRLLSEGKADLESWVTHRFSFERVADALDFVRRNEPGLVKAVVIL